MKNARLFFILTALAAATVFGQEPAKKGAAPAKVTEATDDFAKFKSAEEFWMHIAGIAGNEPPPPKNAQEFVAGQREWIAKQRAATDAFLKRFPEHARRWDAKVVALMASLREERVGGGAVPVDPNLKLIEEVLAAADASTEAKADASFVRVELLAGQADSSKPETLGPLQKAVSGFLEAYSESKHAAEIAEMQIDLVKITNPPDADAIVKRLVASKNPKIAEMAKAAQEVIERLAALKSKPIDLKFTATDGKEVDLAKWRGKVVLIDFWASWCGPCMAEAPNVVSTYQKLHEKGFEIAGISLDEDRAKMEAATKKLAMTWPQYFDGKGWENKISKSYGIDSIPATWLLDKKGMLRDTDVRGEALGAAVEKLLAE
jgi:thiol-disulfide isomerase/thioredoxin